MKPVLILIAGTLVLGGCGDFSDAPRPPVIQTKSEQANYQTAEVPKSETAPADEELRIAVYPKASVLSKNVRDTTVQADIETADPVERAVTFYESQLSAKSDGKAPMTTVEGTKNGYHFVVVIAPKPGGKTAISILGEKA